MVSMKKTNTRLQLTTSTVRVLRGAELEVVRGGAAALLLVPGNPSNSPTACVGIK
jgi:malate/lactate dehydrogenase